MRHTSAAAILCASVLGLAGAGLMPLQAAAQTARPSAPGAPPATSQTAAKRQPAEKLVAAISTSKILIESNFAGQELTVFGAISHNGARAPNYDAIVTFRGPRGAVTVRRKLRWGPFWFNLDNRKYIGIPAYIAVLSNRDYRQIASAAVRDDLRIGIDALIPQQVARRGANDPEFRAALERLREKQELFQEDSEGVTFISPHVFKASINLPGQVPLGQYEVEVAVFADGALEARKNLSFEVTKTDIEQLIATAAREHSIYYGLAIIFLALFLGWLASVVFRRD